MVHFWCVTVHNTVIWCVQSTSGWMFHVWVSGPTPTGGPSTQRLDHVWVQSTFDVYSTWHSLLMRTCTVHNTVIWCVQSTSGWMFHVWVSSPTRTSTNRWTIHPEVGPRVWVQFSECSYMYVTVSSFLMCTVHFRVYSPLLMWLNSSLLMCIQSTQGAGF